jgi:hypothetical protein
MGAKGVRETARLLKVSAAKSEVRRMSAITTPLNVGIAAPEGSYAAFRSAVWSGLH